jgi:hypothetical protein
MLIAVFICFVEYALPNGPVGRIRTFRGYQIIPGKHSHDCYYVATNRATNRVGVSMNCRLHDFALLLR